MNPDIARIVQETARGAIDGQRMHALLEQGGYIAVVIDAVLPANHRSPYVVALVAQLLKAAS